MKRAVFKDQHGQTYSAPMVLQDGQWLMRTSEGLAPVTLRFDDDRGGRLQFVEYRDEPEHLRIEGQGFRALQEAGAQATAAYQTQREQQRREMLDALNQPNARKIAEARAYATALAQKWSPKRPEPIAPPQLTNEVIGTMAEQARWRKRKTEQES